MDSSRATILNDLPDWIIVEEILMRLPSADVLRCRAVQRSWRRATSTDEFMLAHDRRQPSLPLINLFMDHGRDSRLAVFRGDTPNRPLHPFMRCTTPREHHLKLHAALDGLLLVSSMAFCPNEERHFFLCNPATRQCVLLPQLDGFCPGIDIAGFYRHHPTGEYRVLYMITRATDEGERAAYYVLALGSGEARRIGWPTPVWPPSMEHVLLHGLPCSSGYRDPPSVLHRGSLHWILRQPYQVFEPPSDVKVMDDIIAFDTAAETFRWMRRPVQPGNSRLLFELDGALALCGTGDYTRRQDIEVLVMQDYEAEVWASMYRINLSPPVDASVSQLGSRESRYICRLAVLNERELLIRSPAYRLFHCHDDGEFLTDVLLEFHENEDRECGKEITLHSLKESIFPLPVIFKLAIARRRWCGFCQFPL